MAEKSSRSASSTSTSTANVGKLYRLLFDGGTKAVKIQLEKHFTPFPSKLVNFLKTNVGKIQELVERKVINSDQLNQLRPDDGSDPDPEKFDISLTILILTNFCGLRPPRLGWDKMPHKKETSLSVKLVRLRLFRNNLVHRPNTRFEDKEFLELWENLRGILCSLGLPSSDIEKFRRLEDCDDKYYFELLKKWANSEEDSKRKFKAIYENQVKAQQTLQDTNQRVLLVEQNQMEASKLQQVDHKTLADTQQVAQDTNQRVLLVEKKQMEACKLQQVDHETLEDTHQVAQDTNQRVLLVEQNQMEACKLQQEDHRTLEDTHQVAQDTNQRVLLVEQNQMEASKLQQVDHKTLEDTHQVAQDTNQRVLLVEQNQMEASKLQQVDHKTLADTQQVAQDTNQRVLLVEKKQMEACKLQQVDHETLEDTHQVAQDTNQRVLLVEQNQMEACKLQQEDHRTLEDTHQVAQDTNQRVLLVEQNQMEASKLQQVDHKTLEDTHQVAQDTNQRVLLVEQNQMEASKLQQVDHKTLADTQQVAQDTNQRVLLVEKKQMEACKLQQVDHETLEDTHQVAQDTNQRVLLVEQNQMEACKLQQVDHKTLADTHQVAQDTNQRVLLVEQNQMEASKLQQVDHKTLEDTQQVAQDTNQRVLLVEKKQMEACKLQQVDHETLEDTHQVAEGLQRSVEQVLRTQQETQQQIRERAADAKEKRDKGNEDEALRKLAKVNTERVIQYHSGKYQEGTRLRIFEKITLWLDDLTSEDRVMVISGDAGMGKSVISAVVCQRMRHAGRLSGSHFCQHNKARHRNPKIMLQSLAYQLSELLPQYKRELVKALSRNLGEDINNLEVGELFELLFEEPLIMVDDPGRSLLMVIDGLDESEYKGRNELLDVVANHFSTLPGWVRFCVTSRPEINIADRLKKFNPVLLEQDDEENVQDIRLFLEQQLSSVIQAGCKEVVIDALVREAEGHFLYAYLMVDFIKENVSLLTPEELRRTLPSGVSSVYQSYFERLEKELEIGEDQFLTFLSAVAAAREPLPRGFVSKMLLSDSKSPSGPRKVTKAIDSISTLLPVHDDCIVFFHKSLKDWLTDRTTCGQHTFSVDEKQGHVMLSRHCTSELNNVKRKGVHGTEFSNTARYALQHGVYHILESEKVAESTRSFEEIVNNYVTDLDIVYAKLCVNNTASSEDIILTQRQEAFQSLSSESRKALGTLLSLLRKYHGRLSTHPSIIFQVMVNEGGDVFAGEATKVLQGREIPYMEYLHKETMKKVWNKTQAEFPCNSVVACFDVSPTQEFMVCECTNGMIYLWSLKTGKRRWMREVKVEKCYFKPDLPFRLVPNSNVYSCYRSVVFHPTEPIVLPGILSHAYSFEGNLQPLFPRSNCRFSVCSVHGDECKIITDCPGDAKCLVLWNLKNGEEITRTIRNEDVLSFAWSPDGTLLAISHCSGLVCLVDALNCLDTTLAKVATKKPCGMIKFTPDIQFLFCVSSPIPTSKDKHYASDTLSFPLYVIKLPRGTFSLKVLDDDFGQDSLNSESSSKGGFLMGDRVFCTLHRFSRCSLLYLFRFAFVLNKQSVLRVLPGSRKITMLEHEDYSRASWRSRVFRIAFALDGKTIYGTIVGPVGIQVVSLDVSSGDRKAEKVKRESDVFLVPVSEGVVLKDDKPGADVQLWNFELSQIVRSWPNLSDVRDIVPFSDQCVACVGRDFEVSILDTSNGNIMKSIPLCHEGFQSTHLSWHKNTIVCNSKYQLLSTAPRSVQLSDGKNELWKRTLKFPYFFSLDPQAGMFCPTEEFVLVSSTNFESKKTEVLVLEASSGKYLRTLCTVDRILGCAFVSKTECVILCENTSWSNCLPLFNVSTGDFLTVLDIDFVPSLRLASCPQKGLIAIGIWNSSYPSNTVARQSKPGSKR